MSKQELQLLANANNCHLVVIDVQTRLTQVMSDRKSLLQNCEVLIQAAKLLEIPITVTEQYPKGIGATEPQLTNALANDYLPVEKTCFSCCASDQFSTRVDKSSKPQMILCGIESHICVLQTAMDLLQSGKQVFVVADAVDSRSKENKKLALERMQQAGAIITNAESTVFEWLKDAKHAQFKALSALIR